MRRPAKGQTEGQGRQVKREKILAALKAGNTRRAAAAYAGVHWETFYRWLEDATFSDAVYEAEAAPEVLCASTIVNAARKGDWRAGNSWLEKRRRDEWGDEINIRVLSNEQLLALAGASSPGVEAAGRGLAAGSAGGELTDGSDELP